MAGVEEKPLLCLDHPICSTNPYVLIGGFRQQQFMSEPCSGTLPALSCWEFVFLPDLFLKHGNYLQLWHNGTQLPKKIRFLLPAPSEKGCYYLQ